MVLSFFGLAFWVGKRQYEWDILSGTGFGEPYSAIAPAASAIAANLNRVPAIAAPVTATTSRVAAPTTATAALLSTPVQTSAVEQAEQAPLNTQVEKKVDQNKPQAYRPEVEKPVAPFVNTTPLIGARRDSTGSIPVALRDMDLKEWTRIEKVYAPRAKKKLEEGSQKGAKQGPGRGAVFGAIDVALPLTPPILQYPLNHGTGQAQKNIVGLRRMSKEARKGRKCIVYGMGIAEESDFEQMMGHAGCETHAFDCTVDYEAEAVYKKPFAFHQWCIGPKPAASQSSRDNTYSNSATVRLEGKLPCENACDIDVRVVSGGKGGGGNRADFYLQGKKINFRAGRGMNIISLDPLTHKVLTKASYDVFEPQVRGSENDRLASDLSNFPEGRIVLMAVMDTGIDCLLPNAEAAMRECGAGKFTGGFRESYAFIGRKGFEKVAESRSRDMPSTLIFKSLEQTMNELGHTYLDLLKFDIEGFEWGLFQSEILTKRREQLPEQISFELHTSAANPGYVPHDVVKGKGFKQVNKLMLDLFNAGYRITSKEVNNGDPACAEFVALNVQ